MTTCGPADQDLYSYDAMSVYELYPRLDECDPYSITELESAFLATSKAPTMHGFLSQLEKMMNLMNKDGFLWHTANVVYIFTNRRLKESMTNTDQELGNAWSQYVVALDAFNKKANVSTL